VETLDNNYKLFFTDVKERIRKAQYEALKKVNTELINLYWDIGKMIFDRLDGNKRGNSIVENLAIELQNEFPGLQGFSYRNLWYMKKFYSHYSTNLKLQPLVAEISWTKNTIILEKCKDDLEREFYIKSTRKFGWTKNVLIHQIENETYEKYLLNQTNFDNAITEKYTLQAKLAVKDEYTFDFLELSDEHSEHELEVKLVNNIRRFLTEMGGYFTFIGNQFRIELGGEEFFIDLLLFHRQLKCLVAIELKIGKFIPEFAGKMEFYLNVLNDKVKLSDENPSIGIILCKDKNRTIVEYALKEKNQPIGVSTYKISKTLPLSLKNYLPTPAEIIKRLDGLNDEEIH